MAYLHLPFFLMFARHFYFPWDNSQSSWNKNSCPMLLWDVEDKNCSLVWISLNSFLLLEDSSLYDHAGSLPYSQGSLFDVAPQWTSPLQEHVFPFSCLCHPRAPAHTQNQPAAIISAPAPILSNPPSPFTVRCKVLVLNTQSQSCLLRLSGLLATCSWPFLCWFALTVIYLACVSHSSVNNRMAGTAVWLVTYASQCRVSVNSWTLGEEEKAEIFITYESGTGRNILKAVKISETGL